MNSMDRFFGYARERYEIFLSVVLIKDMLVL